MREIFSDFEILDIDRDSLADGVFIFTRKPADLKERNLADYALYSIVAKRRCVEVSPRDQKIFDVIYSIKRFRRRYLSLRPRRI